MVFTAKPQFFGVSPKAVKNFLKALKFRYRGIRHGTLKGDF
jgi:hypothetical protein